MSKKVKISFIAYDQTINSFIVDEKDKDYSICRAMEKGLTVVGIE